MKTTARGGELLRGTHVMRYANWEEFAMPETWEARSWRG